MARLLTIKDFSRESYLASARAVTAAIIVGLLTLALVGRLAHLQVLKHQHFTTLSENNRVKIVPVAPVRGLIFDRNGEVLAQNLPAYGIEVVPELVEDVDALISELREIIEITDADEEEFLAVVARKPRFEKIPLRLRLDDQEVARFAVNRHRFPGVDIDARLTRNYPHGELGVHLVGYVGRIDKRELDSIDQADYRGTSHIGKTGIEASHEDWLHGKVGYQRVETNAQGRILRVLERHDPVPGSNLFLTMDVKLQRTAEAALGDERGAIVALEPLTGAVLAMASTPRFDPNLFVHGIDVDTYRSLQRSPERPLFNRAINGQYPPGSTIKPFLGLAGLEHDIGHARGKSWCPGWFRLPGRERKYRDWKKHGHGRIGLRDAIVQSCDVYFYELALALGIDRMHEFLSSFGFGARTGIRLGGESPGLMPSRTWKRNARGQSWYPGETVITGIGQGYMLTTPLQLASAAAAIATRGTRMRPRIVDRAVDPGSGETEAVEPETNATISSFDAANWKRIVEAMAGVVHGPRGTAKRINAGIAYRMAGKTGTAQVVGIGQNEEYDADKLDKRFHDHGLFLAFAPVEEPRIAVAVIVENGGAGSSSAAPLARIVIDAWLGDTPPPAPGQRTLRAAVSEGDQPGPVITISPVPG
ncbi:MAG: penicillin-binding protein 2 [Chromatiales bacterium]|nr:penicillin-binding protein 2 [Chromatiales bacterium]